MIWVRGLVSIVSFDCGTLAEALDAQVNVIVYRRPDMNVLAVELPSTCFAHFATRDIPAAAFGRQNATAGSGPPPTSRPNPKPVARRPRRLARPGSRSWVPQPLSFHSMSMKCGLDLREPRGSGGELLIS